MLNIRLFRSTVLCTVILIAGSLAASCQGVKLISNGEFADKDGHSHSWKIDGAHTLTWDGNPYIPVGGVFYSRYVCNAQTEANWQADVAALDTIKNAGITDLLLKYTGPISLCNPAALQKLLDYLDSSDFAYGIDLADGPKTALAGFVIQPSRHRIADIINDASYSFSMPDVDSALWLLCSARNSDVVSSGGAQVKDGKIRLDIKARADESCVLLLFPHKDFSENGQSIVPDLWSGFDEYRDRLIPFLSKLKFGKGLRFFLDPIQDRLDPEGEDSSVVPDSSDFRIEFESYLAKKYLNIGSLNASWGIAGDNLGSFMEAARVIPLWCDGRGLSALYDRARGKRYAVDVPRSKYWEDLSAFRDSSTQFYLNEAADLVKRNAANVPVIYRVARHGRILTNSSARTGFDGLAVECYGRGNDVVTKSAGEAYALVDESSCSTCFFVAGTADTIARDKKSVGYESSEAMTADLSSLGEIGAKGIFINGLQVLPEDAWKNRSLTAAPGQLVWLKEFKDKFASAERAEFLPEVVYFPSEKVVGAEIERLGPGQWWLPSLKTGAGMSLGDSIGGYQIASQPGVCIWSRTGPTTISFPIEQGEPVKLLYPKDNNGLLTFEKKRVVVKLGSEPVIIDGLQAIQMLPIEEAEGVISKLSILASQGKAAGLRVGSAEDAVKHSQDVLKNGLSVRAYEIAYLPAQSLAAELGTYIWLEGEQCTSHNFDGTVSAIGASAGGYLAVSTKIVPSMSPYTAGYAFDVPKDATNEIWIAGITSEAGASPLSFSIDGAPWQQATMSTTTVYGRRFGWTKIGSSNLLKGPHTLHIRVDAPNQDGVYNLGIDAIVISPLEFRPNGIKKP